MTAAQFFRLDPSARRDVIARWATLAEAGVEDAAAGELVADLELRGEGELAEAIALCLGLRLAASGAETRLARLLRAKGGGTWH
jgi:hypothetical protein